jgi:hypothetical protein
MDQHGISAQIAETLRARSAPTAAPAPSLAIEQDAFGKSMKAFGGRLHARPDAVLFSP